MNGRNIISVICVLILVGVIAWSFYQLPASEAEAAAKIFGLLSTFVVALVALCATIGFSVYRFALAQLQKYVSILYEAGYGAPLFEDQEARRFSFCMVGVFVMTLTILLFLLSTALNGFKPLLALLMVMPTILLYVASSEAVKIWKFNIVRLKNFCIQVDRGATLALPRIKKK
jgi:hypothetical protein